MRRPPGATDRHDQRWRAIYRIVAVGLGGSALLGSGTLTLLTTDHQRRAGLLLGLGLLAIAVSLATTAKHLLSPPEAEEERHAPVGPACAGCDGGSGPTRRRWFLAGGLAAVVAAVTGGLVLRDGTAARALRGTPWRRGDRLVTDDGRSISADDLEVGALLTVWPEGSVGVADAQVVLLRLDPSRLGSRPQQRSGSPDGHVAYSKLCTHMGCPVGLFQQDPDVLICPCHQAVFDVFDGARPVQGPADRPLPQLPLMIGDDGTLRAADGFSDAVGAGWWGRPR